MENSINILGSGLAGLSMAINLARKNIKSNLISNLSSERSQSVLAEGGINACLNVMGESDTIEEHFNDTIKGGCYIEDEKNVWQLVSNAPIIVNELIRLGVPFNFEDGHIIQRNFGGQKKKRTAYAKSSTGKMIVTALVDEARKYEALGLINRYSHHECVDIDIINNELKGIIVKDNYTKKYYYFEGKVILACGGLNGFFDGHVTGSTSNNANISAIAFSKGLEFRNLEFIQYHPTTVDIKTKRLLVSEAARGEGGRLFVYKGDERYYFMEDRHELKNLAPRDVISREEYFILNDDTYKNQIYLDLTSIPKKTWENKLSDLRLEIIDYLNLDSIKEPIPISPGIHFFMGGIKVDINHKTNIKNLYAIGEAASIYHGANRLGGNSMLGAICGGLICAKNIALENDDVKSSIKEIEYKEILSKGIINDKIVDILISSMGIARNEDILLDGISKLDSLDDDMLNDLEHKKILFAKAIIKSALERKESRGAHYRTDYPNSLESFKKVSISKFINDDIDIRFE